MASKYDQKTKDEVIAFIQNYNAEKGRGGQSAAVKKWKLNAVTLKSWLEKAGVETPGRGGGKRKAKKGGSAKSPRKAVRKPGRRAAAAGGDIAGTLNRMVAIRGEIAKLEAEYAKLKDTL